MTESDKLKTTKLFQSLLSPELGTCQHIVWRPLVDVYEDSSGWIVKLELAGVRETDLNIKISGNKLIIEGIRKDCSVEDCYRIHSMEISYNRFSRSIDFPCDIENGKLQTEYHDGMLFVHVKMEEGDAH